MHPGRICLAMLRILCTVVRVVSSNWSKSSAISQELLLWVFYLLILNEGLREYLIFKNT